jgi:F420-dependent oxidoreductase-like protein
VSAHPIDVGIYVPQLQLGYEDLLGRARLVEALGFHSFWVYDHLYGPMLPDVAAFEGWTVATALLAHTERLRVGHLVLCNNFRHPALLAKMATTLDVISGGRLELGIGSGSYQPEHHEAGLPWGSVAERSDRLGEALEIITKMFEPGRTTFEGEHYRVRDLPNLPPPVQSPRPPIHVGGAGERRTLPLVARYADVWNVPTYALGDLAHKQQVLDDCCAAIGRDPAEIRRSVEAVCVIAPTQAEVDAVLPKAERRFPGAGWGLHDGGFVGTPERIVERVHELAAQGFTLFVFFCHDRASDATLHLLADEVLPNL